MIRGEKPLVSKDEWTNWLCNVNEFCNRDPSDDCNVGKGPLRVPVRIGPLTISAIVDPGSS